MNKMLLLLPIILFSCASTPEQEQDAPSAPKTLPEANRIRGLRIQPVHHSALVIEGNEGVVYVDPHDGAEWYKDLAPPDLVLITDIHEDHLDTATLRRLDLHKARIVAPAAVVERLPEDLRRITSKMTNGGRDQLNGILVQAIPMYNMSDEKADQHPKGRGNGYVVTISDRRVYISGDTEDIPEMRSLEQIDVAFVCMNEPYTMSVEQAAGAVAAFKPAMVYPYHYRGKNGMSDVQEFKRLVNERSPDTEVVLANWYTE